MIRKILCPTDLSPAAQNAVAYAAKLCQKTGATLELLNVEPVFAPDLVFAGRKKSAEAAGMAQELEKMSYELNKFFHISCSYDVQTGNLPLDETVSRKADDETLIIVGTNGADDLFQRIFGSNAFNIAKQAYSNVLVIPEGISYGTVETMAFAWDYSITKPQLRQVKQTADDLGCRLVFLHVSAHESSISKDVFNALSDRITEVLGEKGDVEFRRMFASGIREGLDEYMKEKHAGLLAISLKSGRLVRRAFRAANGIGSLPAYPLLIIHSRKLPGRFS